MLDHAETTEEARADKALADLLTIPVQLRRVREEVGHSPEGAAMNVEQDNHEQGPQTNSEPTAPIVPTLEQVTLMIKQLRTKREKLVEKHQAEVSEIDDTIKGLKKSGSAMLQKL